MKGDRNLAITGRPGCGKTTLLRRLIERFAGRIGGFWTEEIRQAGKRVGFAIEDIWGNRGTLAHVDLSGGPKVGRYTVNTADIERIACRALRRALDECEAIACDEVAKMELQAACFAPLILQALESPRPFVFTLQQSRHPFIEQIRRRSDVEVIVLSPANRDEVLQGAVDWLAERLGGA